MSRSHRRKALLRRMRERAPPHELRNLFAALCATDADVRHMAARAASGWPGLTPAERVLAEERLYRHKVTLRQYIRLMTIALRSLDPHAEDTNDPPG